MAASFERPALLFQRQGLLRGAAPAEKAFKLKSASHPSGFSAAHCPSRSVHIDTGHNFPEVIDFRDQRVAEMGERLVVGHRKTHQKGTIRLAHLLESRNGHQTVTLLETIEEHRSTA